MGRGILTSLRLVASVGATAALVASASLTSLSKVGTTIVGGLVTLLGLSVLVLETLRWANASPSDRKQSGKGGEKHFRLIDRLTVVVALLMAATTVATVIFASTGSFLEGSRIGLVTQLELICSTVLILSAVMLRMVISRKSH